MRVLLEPMLNVSKARVLDSEKSRQTTSVDLMDLKA